MNLWVKRTGQLLMAVLFLISCEDETFLLGFKNQNKKFGVYYQEFLVGEGTLLSIDSAITDNSLNYKRLLIGEHNDPFLGTLRTEAFAQFSPNGTKLAAKVDHEYVYDSIIVQLRLDGYSYGLGNTGNIGKFSINRITGTDISYTNSNVSTIPETGKEVTYKTPNYYFATSSPAIYSGAILGETRFEELTIYDQQEIRSTTTLTLDKLRTAKDTLMATARLDDEFGLELFGVALEDANEEFSDPEKFKARFKGLAIIPSESNSVLGINPSNLYSRIKLYYHSTLGGEVVDTLSRDFYLNGNSYHTINVNRINGLPPADPPYTGVDPGDMRVVQNGNPIITKIDLNSFYTEFADVVSEKNIVINSAELLIESVSSPDEYNPIQGLELRVMKENDGYLNYKTITQQDRDSLRKFNIFTDARYYYVNSDLVYQTQSSYPANLIYDDDKERYSGAITIFTQELLNNKKSNYRIRYLGLYPASITTTSLTATPIGKTIDRSIFLKGNIKLRVYYTMPDKSNL